MKEGEKGLACQAMGQQWDPNPRAKCSSTETNLAARELGFHKEDAQGREENEGERDDGDLGSADWSPGSSLAAGRKEEEREEKKRLLEMQK